jgi:hypothetical protein
MTVSTVVRARVATLDHKARCMFVRLLDALILSVCSSPAFGWLVRSAIVSVSRFASPRGEVADGVGRLLPAR